jgi:hypothetical protein
MYLDASHTLAQMAFFFISEELSMLKGIVSRDFMVYGPDCFANQ